MLWLFVVLGAFAFGLLVCSNFWTIVDYFCQQDTWLAELDAGNGRTIAITAKSCWEANRPVYYEVKERGNILSRKRAFDYDDGKSRSFSLVFAENKSLVGVIDTTSKSPSVVILYDFGSGASWGAWTGGMWNWSDLFHRLQKENPQIKAPAAFVN